MEARPLRNKDNEGENSRSPSFQAYSRAGRRIFESRSDNPLRRSNFGLKTTVDMTPENQPGQAWRLHSLGIALSARYSTTGAIIDLEEGIKLARQLVDITPKLHPRRAERLNSLGNKLSDKYVRIGEIADLDESIQIGKQAVDEAVEGNPDRAMYLNDLGAPLADRYKRTGLMADLDEAIRVTRQAVDMTPEDHPKRVIYLSNLGVHLSERYKKTRAMADLEGAILLVRLAVKLTPPRHLDRVGRLHNLGKLVGSKFARTGVITDLEEAIQIARVVVGGTPKDNLNRFMYLDNLAFQLRARYKRMQDITDLEEAIQLTREVVDATPRDSPDWSQRLSILEMGLRDRYLRKREKADLEEAIRLARQAADATAKDDPLKARKLLNLAIGLMKKSLGTRETGIIEEIIVHLRSALYQPNALVTIRIAACRLIVPFYIFNSDWQQAYDASNIAVGLISKLTARSLENSDKQHLLRQVVGVASDAAAVALQAEKGAPVALNFLEQGRGVLAASLDELRTDILGLRNIYPELADQFVCLRNELKLSDNDNNSLLDEPSWLAQGNRRYDAGDKLDRVIVEIRKQPGFEDFLIGPGEREMQAAASSGPIVVLNMSRYRCDAVLVEEHQTRVLALPRLNRKDIIKKVQMGGLGSPAVLEWLWDVAANPILDALGFVQPPSTDNWPHVWWIPTGPLTKFPIHAAGRHNSGSVETVLDRVMSSYSPSIKTIIQSRTRRVTQSPSRQALLVSMQDTPGHGKLPFVMNEVAMLHDLCRLMGLDPIEPPRRKQDIMSYLPNCKIFHFAGHGNTDTADPSQSHLLLNDWKSDPLTVSTLLEMNLREGSPFLAYLSACGTGQVKDDKSVDESIHLISACQLAGFRHVIGTLWEVNDESCVDMSRITYEEIRNGGMTDESVCRGLHKATRELRKYWLDKMLVTSRGNKSIRQVESEDRSGIIGDGAQEGGGLQRDVVSFDDDEETDVFPWVPYVHFGV